MNEKMHYDSQMATFQLIDGYLTIRRLFNILVKRRFTVVCSRHVFLRNNKMRKCRS